MNPKELKEYMNESYIKSDERSKFINDFQYDEDLSNNKTAVYFNPDTKQAKIIHRGTNETASDWQNNLALALGVYDFTRRNKKGLSTQKSVGEKYGDKNVTTIGHSQGAFLAKKHGTNSKNVITLNEAYIPSKIYNKPKKNEISIRSKGDLVSLPKLKDDLITSLFYNKRSKNNITIPTENKYDVFKNHSPNVLDKLDSKIKIGL
jgi:hypothetical protein